MYLPKHLPVPVARAVLLARIGQDPDQRARVVRLVDAHASDKHSFRKPAAPCEHLKHHVPVAHVSYLQRHMYRIYKDPNPRLLQFHKVLGHGLRNRL